MTQITLYGNITNVNLRREKEMKTTGAVQSAFFINFSPVCRTQKALPQGMLRLLVGRRDFLFVEVVS